MAACFLWSHLALLFVLLLVVINGCDARKKHRKSKAKAITLWSQWRCVTGGMQMERSRKVMGTGRCPGGHGMCHKIQNQVKNADGKCGKCGIDDTHAILTASTVATSSKNVSVGTSFVVDGVAIHGNDVYVLCHDSSGSAPFEYKINIYDASAGYTFKDNISQPADSSGDNLNGLTVCKGALYFTDTTKNLIYQLDIATGVFSSKSSHFYEDYYFYQYDDVTEDASCNIVVASLGQVIKKVTNQGFKNINVSSSGAAKVTSVSLVPGCYVAGYFDGTGNSYVAMFNAAGGLVATASGTTFADATGVIANGAFVLVADNRVALLNSKLAFIKDLVSGVTVNHMWLDVIHSRLYMASQYDEWVRVYDLMG